MVNTGTPASLLMHTGRPRFPHLEVLRRHGPRPRPSGACGETCTSPRRWSRPGLRWDALWPVPLCPPPLSGPRFLLMDDLPLPGLLHATPFRATPSATGSRLPKLPRLRREGRGPGSLRERFASGGMEEHAKPGQAPAPRHGTARHGGQGTARRDMARHGLPAQGATATPRRPSPRRRHGRPWQGEKHHSDCIGTPCTPHLATACRTPRPRHAHATVNREAPRHATAPKRGQPGLSVFSLSAFSLSAGPGLQHASGATSQLTLVNRQCSALWVDNHTTL